MSIVKDIVQDIVQPIVQPIIPGGGGTPSGPSGFFLLETGDKLILEAGDFLLLEGDE